LVIDEPDIYLHSDLQRQLIGVLRELGPQIVLATHSAEIIAEVEPQALLNINKRFQSGRRIKDTRELQQVFQVLGSNLNPTLTQLAKTRRVVFVEGKDFQILSRFARKLGLDSVANRSDFAVIPVEGFNPQKVKDFASGMEATLGGKLLKTAIFDRDYRSTQDVQRICADLTKFCWWAVVHDCKELENFLLEPNAIGRAIARRFKDRSGEKSGAENFSENVNDLLMRLAEKHRNAVQARLIASRQQFERSTRSQLDAVSISEAALQDFDIEWATPKGRMRMVPGKDLLSELNEYLQSTYKISVSALLIVDCFTRDEIDPSLVALLGKLEEMRRQEAEDQPTFEFS
jgi:hypothetical protein